MQFLILFLILFFFCFSVAVPKHGLQTVGKVGAGRRVPPPANIPSLKKLNTTSNNNTTVVANAVANVNINSNVNIVPTGGQGWAASKDDERFVFSPFLHMTFICLPLF